MDASVVFRYFPNLSDFQKKQLEQLGSLYEEWNSKINVVSRKDIDQLYVHHVLHSLAIAKIIQPVPTTRFLDIGTGGGFPGIPLAILFPDSTFHLVDSIGKKIKVVHEVANAIGLQNLTAEHGRAEKVKGSFDFIISRAVARTRLLYMWCHQKIDVKGRNELDNGFILLKGGDLTEELRESGKPYIETRITDFFEEDFFETKKVIYIPK